MASNVKITIITYCVLLSLTRCSTKNTTKLGAGHVYDTRPFTNFEDGRGPTNDSVVPDTITTTDDGDGNLTTTIDPNDNNSSTTTEDPNPNPGYDCSEENSTTLQLDIDNLNQLRLEHSTLKSGEACNYGKVSKLDENLKIGAGNSVSPSGNPDFTNAQLVEICKSLRSLKLNGDEKYCSPQGLLYCDSNNICVCMESGYQSRGPKEVCLIPDDSVCADSWKLDNTAKMQGLPESSPDCESGICSITSVQGVYKCDEDSWGLLMIKKTSSATTSTTVYLICIIISAIFTLVLF